MKVSVAEAKNKLPELIRAVEDGETITICRRGQAVVDIVRTRKSPRRKPLFDRFKGKIAVPDENWWKAMTEKEIEEFINTGRY